MTNARSAATKPAGRTPHRSFDLIWKNALLATSLGATLIGWTWLAQTDASAAQATDVALQSPTQAIEPPTTDQPNRLWQSQPLFPQASTGSGARVSTPSNAAIGLQFQQPQRLFRRPVTRTRHS